MQHDAPNGGVGSLLSSQSLVSLSAVLVNVEVQWPMAKTFVSVSSV